MLQQPWNNHRLTLTWLHQQRRKMSSTINEIAENAEKARSVSMDAVNQASAASEQNENSSGTLLIR